MASADGAGAGLTRLLELLPAARPAEAAVVLATLDDAELAAAIAAAPEPTPGAVSDFVLAAGGPAAAAALARRALTDRIDAGVDDVLHRLVRRGDPALDAVLLEGARARPAHDWIVPLLDRPRPGPDSDDVADTTAGFHHGSGDRPADADYGTGTGLDPEAEADDEPVTFDMLRHRALDDLARGTLSPDGLLSGPPALVAVVLAAPIAHTVPRHPARPGCAALRAGLAALLADRLGDEPAAWSAAIGRVDTWPRALTGLLADIAAGAPIPARGATPPSPDRDVLGQASNVLLAAAPPGVAAVCLGGRLSPSLIHRMVRRWPLCRPLVEHALGPDLHPFNSDLPRLLAENELTPDGVLVRLLEQHPDDGVMAAAILTREFASGPVRMLALRRCEALSGKPYDSLAGLMSPALAGLLEAADDPAWLHATLRRVGSQISVPVRLRGYAVLARLSGPEAVWAAELQVAGDLRRVAEAVRVSMAEGSDAPILAAARAAQEDEQRRLRALGSRGAVWGAETTMRLRTDEGLDDPLAWPREDLVREVLEGRPERWRALTGLLRDGASEPWEELITSAALKVAEKEGA